MVAWIKSLFTLKEYAGTGKIFKESYKRFNLIINDVQRSDDLGNALKEIDLMTAMMATRGEGRLVKECLALFKHATKEI